MSTFTSDHRNSSPMGTQDQIPVMAIRLRKTGQHTVVDVEIGGSWIEVIRERSDGEFCHIVEASGIYSLLERFLAS